jgi:AbrB family looped-hinge helix DNA binding protein
VTAQPLAPVIPSSAVPAARRHALPGAGRPLPLARPVRSAPQGVVYGIARVDASGRICERAVITALGWAGGDRLTLTADAGMVTLPASGYITIPAALRRRCGLEPGDQVLLAALPGEGTLAAYCLAVVDEAIRAHGALPHAHGGKP